VSATIKLVPASNEVAAAGPDYSVQLALLAAIVESSDDAIVSKTLEGRVNSWNAGAMRLFGYTAEEMMGKPITTIIPPELQDEERQILEKVRRGERIDHFETTRLTKDGRRIPISLTVSPVRDGNGVIIGASKVARDISDRKRADEAVRRSEEALREANRRKDEFMALLAHELRNPLAPIRYALAANGKPGRTDLQRRHAEEIIERQVAHMSRLLDDLLNVSRMTRGTLELKKCPTELTSILGTAIEAARPVLDKKRQSLSLDLPKDVLRLEADPVRLAQVFSNLLVNAAKYTDPGGHIEVLASREGPQIVVAVRDNGIGISAELMPRLFTLFTQADSSLERSEGGLGVGLALVHGLVTLHGGAIEACSAGVNRGSEFIVRLPVGSCVPPSDVIDPPSEETPCASALKIVVVDDNRDIADTCAAVLELSGHRVQTAYSGEGALLAAETFRPDVMLLDIGLPDMDGYQLATRIRKTPWGREAVLVAVTGWGQEKDKDRAFDAGFDHHLTKPIDPAALESLLQSID
jgi:PAS domain S-box-containing protein